MSTATTERTRPETWRGGWQDAACIGYDPELWFRDAPTVHERRDSGAQRARKRDVALAKSICGICELKQKCLEAHQGERYGIFGGTTPGERGFKGKKR